MLKKLKKVEGEENKMSQSYKGIIAKKIVDQNNAEKAKIEKAKREQERNPINERPYGGLLNKLGRMACRKIFFEKTSLEKMTFPKIGNIEDVTKTKNFISGYNSEMDRIKNALNNNYLATIEKDYLEDVAVKEEFINNKTR